MLKQLKKLPVKQGISLAAVILLLIVFGGLTYSWFDKNRLSTDTIDGIVTEEDSPTVMGDYLIYKRTTIENADGSTSKVYSVMNSLNAMSVNTYDSIFGRNEDTAIILRIPITGASVDGVQPLKLTMTRENPAALTGYCADNYGLMAAASLPGNASGIEAGKIINFLSNITEFKLAIIPELNEVTDNQVIYEIAKGVFDGTKTSTGASIFSEATDGITPSFAKWQRTGKVYEYISGSKRNTLIWNTGSNYGENALCADGKLYLYLEIDYNQGLIASYLQNHSGNSKVGKLGQAELIEFVGDLKEMELSLGT